MIRINEENMWSSNLISIIEEFQDCFDSMERYELLFDYAKNHPSPLPIEDWNEGNKITGCQSRAHVSCNVDDEGNFILMGGADAQIVQGLMAITAIAVNGMTPISVTKMTPKYAEEMGIHSSLTPSRANGFLNMFRRVQEEAKKLMK